MAADRRRSVLFVCVKNGGKSQMAEALMRHEVGDAVEVSSAGTRPGTSLNEESAAAVAEVGASMAGGTTKHLDPELLRTADRVVVLGAEARVEPVAGMRGTIETWETDEPSQRGIEGMERMRLVRDDILDRVRRLAQELTDSGAGADGEPAGETDGTVETDGTGPSVRVFEPALCCNTGVCGPDVDEVLVRFTADLEYLQGQGADIARHNLANDPGAFAATAPVAAFLKVAGSAGLPLVLVDGITVATGRYPDRAELSRLAGLEPAGPDAPDPQGRSDLGLSAAGASGGGCCGSGTGTGCC